MGKKANIIFKSVHKTKDWNSNWYSDLHNYGHIFKKDYFIYTYFKSLKELNQKHNLESCCFRIIRIFKDTILELTLIKKQKTSFDLNLSKKFNISDIKWNLLLKINQVFKLEKNLIVFSKQKTGITAKYIALFIARLIEKRLRFKSAIIQRFLKKVTKKFNGLQIKCKGRINNADRAASEQISFGSIPMQSFAAELDFGLAIANTSKGLQSIKVWTCKI